MNGFSPSPSTARTWTRPWRGWSETAPPPEDTATDCQSRALYGKHGTRSAETDCQSGYHGGAWQPDPAHGMTAAEIDACQHLRYRVFYEELDAKPVAEAAASRRDADRFDTICDHLVVIRRHPGRPATRSC